MSSLHTPTVADVDVLDLAVKCPLCRVRRGGMLVSGAMGDEDWGACSDHEAFSVLLPLRRVDEGARRAYRLEYKTWHDADKVHTYEYSLGDAVVVDGRAPHRTCPFSAADLAECAGERVLVCLNYASTDPSAREGQLDTMRRQTPHFFSLPDA